jgi:branched-chain amino acid aminotransferase
MENLIVYAAGDFVPESQAAVPVLDHGFLYGDGVWDGMRVYGGKVFKLEEHLQRLYDLAQICAIEIPLSPTEMGGIITELLERNGFPAEGYVRPIVTRGAGPNPPGITSDGCEPAVYVLFHSWTSEPSRPLRLKIVAQRRRPPDCMPVAKTLSFMDSTMARVEARRWGADAGLLLDLEGNIAESDGNNFFMVKQGELLTPPTRYILSGITRKVVLEIAEERGIPVTEKDLAPSEAYVADESFLASTGGGIVPVDSIDGRPMRKGSPGPVTSRIMKWFDRMVTA